MLSVKENIEKLVEGIPGWSPEDQLFSLYLLALSTNNLEGDVWEIGSWCGRSSVVIADAIKDSNSTLHCIDLFPNLEDWYENKDGSYSFEVDINGKKIKSYFEQTVWKEPFNRDIVTTYNTHGHNLQNIFEKNMQKKGCQDTVKAYKGIAPDYANSYKGKIRMAFVDGDHSYDGSRADVEAVLRYLVPGGWIVFDDAFSVYNGVDQVIEEMIINSKEFDIKKQLTRKCFAARKK